MCKVPGCKRRSLVQGWELCEPCAERMKIVPIAVLADAIVELDQKGVLEPDRQQLFKQYNITKDQLAAAQQIAEERYTAVKLRRRMYRGW